VGSDFSAWAGVAGSHVKPTALAKAARSANLRIQSSWHRSSPAGLQGWLLWRVPPVWSGQAWVGVTHVKLVVLAKTTSSKTLRANCFMSFS